METENYTYDQYSRKRPLDNDDGYDTYKKNGNPSYGGGKPILKFLVPNFMAGKLIGKGGSNIAELQSKFDASIQISPNKEFYPGTTDRIVSISANIGEIISFTEHLSDLVVEEEQSDRNNPLLRPEVRFVVSNIAAGLVIGKGGASIKAIQASSQGAKISLSKKEESVSGERVLIVSGDGPSRMGACKQIIDVMAAEPEKMSNNNLKYSQNNTMMGPSSGGGGGSSMPQQQNHHHQQHNNNNGNNNHHNNRGGGPTPFSSNQDEANYNNFATLATAMTNAMSSMSRAGGFGNNLPYMPKSGAKPKFQCVIEVPDKMVGTILGKNGCTINEFGRSSGARLTFSGKDEFAPNTTNRILTITGSTMQQVQKAYVLVDERLSQVEAEFDYPFGHNGPYQ